ncbi:hypothetical protein ACHAQH_002595, partial [Verticillium albo-atrum]
GVEDGPAAPSLDADAAAALAAAAGAALVTAAASIGPLPRPPTPKPEDGIVKGTERLVPYGQYVSRIAAARSIGYFDFTGKGPAEAYTAYFYGKREYDEIPDYYNARAAATELIVALRALAESAAFREAASAAKATLRAARAEERAVAATEEEAEEAAAPTTAAANNKEEEEAEAVVIAAAAVTLAADPYALGGLSAA